MSDQGLKRSLSLPLITLYGLGTTVGAGIYALLGKVAAQAGLLAPFSFVLAAVLAGFTACSFAELSARIPKSAGEAIYVREGFSAPRLAVVVGLLVALSGIVSAAAIANGAVGYFHEFIAVPREILIPLIVLILGALAAWGISESVVMAGVFTVVEVLGLVVVVWAAHEYWGNFPDWAGQIGPSFSAGGAFGIVAGAYLAFYAFLGFEDMVNVAEEVKDVQRNLPAAIFLTLGITTAIYFVVAVTAVLALPLDVLAASGAPLADIFEHGTGWSPAVISIIAIFAVMNGALIQIIMAARVLYGLGNERHLPGWFAHVHPRTRTPLISTALATAVVIALALWFPITVLAEATSVIILVVFTLVNLALVMLKRRDPLPSGVRVYPVIIPVIGFLVSGAAIVTEIVRRLPF